MPETDFDLTAGYDEDGNPQNSEEVMIAILNEELQRYEGVLSQDPETGAGIGTGASYIKQYTNRLFGAPFQLLDSVDKRFDDVNSYVGTEYLRNFLLNSPILHIKPGLPKYTGGASGTELVESIKEVYTGTNTGSFTFVEALLMEMASDTVFKQGSKLQRRMFGFRETYATYMSYVNYMCRSMATFLNLTHTKHYPNGTFTNGHNNSVEPFENLRWENYRMLRGAETPTPWQQLKKMGRATTLGALAGTVGTAIDEIAGIGKAGVSAIVEKYTQTMEDAGGALDGILRALGVIPDALAAGGAAVADAAGDAWDTITDTAVDNFTEAANTSVVEVTMDKINSVMFMVEPVQFTESLTNRTKDSVIESTIEQIDNSLGKEISWITGSHVDFGHLEGISEFLGSTVNTMSQFLEGVVDKVSGGGFVSNLFSGALGSIKGQKMIYPKIYDQSESTMNYEFTVNLTSPYGDVYNYYMNIVVPLMHLIALAAPRMTTSNSVSSPFMVQAFIPGMCTCGLGIISSMEITKNPSTKHVSVNGYPLDVQVKFTIEELYNALSISPANDPASFLWNECLNDYMANLAGLQPSTNTYTNQRVAMFQSLERYFQNQEYFNDFAEQKLEDWEELVNPFIASGS